MARRCDDKTLVAGARARVRALPKPFCDALPRSEIPGARDAVVCQSVPPEHVIALIECILEELRDIIILCSATQSREARSVSNRAAAMGSDEALFSEKNGFSVKRGEAIQ